MLMAQAPSSSSSSTASYAFGLGSRVAKPLRGGAQPSTAAAANPHVALGADHQQQHGLSAASFFASNPPVSGAENGAAAPTAAAVPGVERVQAAEAGANGKRSSWLFARR